MRSDDDAQSARLGHGLDGEGWGWMGEICLEEDVLFDDSL